MNKVIEKTRSRLMIAALAIAVCVGAETTHGQLLGWGENTLGQLGIVPTVNQPSPVNLNMPDVTAVCGGNGHSVFLKADGTLRSVGRNTNGQLGNGTTTNSTTPVPVSMLTDVVSISCGADHTLALKSDGTVWGWGFNGLRELGDGTGIDRTVPVPVGGGVIGFGNVVAISAGFSHSLALTASGTVWGWGNNQSNQVSDDALPIQPVPFQIATINNVIDLGAGVAHSVALKTDGTVWVWGRNAEGQVGNGTFSDNSCLCVLVPTQSSITGVADVSAGGNFNVALKPDGTVWSWGRNDRGELGIGTVSTSFPNAVPSPTQTIVSNIIAVRAGTNHVVARRSDGSVWTWGNNESGQLGNPAGTTPSCTCKPTPAQSLAGAGNCFIGRGSSAGFSGKPSISIDPGSGINVWGDGITIAIPNVASPTTLTITAIAPNSTGLIVPPGYTVLANAPAFDLTASSPLSGEIIACVKVPTVFSDVVFANLRILHGENGMLVDRTVLPNNYASRRVCASVSSLSPFVIAQVSPTAANVAISGRVTDTAGRPIGRATVSLSDGTGLTRVTITNPFGYYRIGGVPTGQTYTITPQHRRYNFTPQVIAVNEELTGVDFVGMEATL